MITVLAGENAAQFHALEIAGDAQHALVVMQAFRIRKISKQLDAAERKAIDDQLKAGTVNAASVDGAQGVRSMMESIVLFRQYGRMGSEEENSLVMHFATWRIFEVDALHHALRPIGPEFGEASGGFQGVVGITGCPVGDCQQAAMSFSHAAGLLAVSLEDRNPFLEGHHPPSTGLLLMRTCPP